MGRSRTSRIWKISREELEVIVKKSVSLSEILGYFGLRNIGGNYKCLKSRLVEEHIDYSHIPLGQNSNRGRNVRKTAVSLESVLVEHSNYNRSYLKKRLIREGIIVEKCSICGLPPVWNGKKIVLIMDHINGMNDDNRIENLRLVCPNCNSQLETFAGRNFAKKRYCKGCGNRVFGGRRCCSKECVLVVKRRSKLLRRKAARPTIECLEEEIRRLGYSATGRKYGVSDNAIRKWLNSGLAQRAEQEPLKLKVGGSNPSSATRTIQEPLSSL